MPLTGQTTLRGGGGIPPADEYTVREMVDAIAPCLRSGVSDRLESLPKDLMGNQKLLSVMDLRNAVQSITDNVCKALAKHRGQVPPCGSPSTLWLYLEKEGVVLPHERELIERVMVYLQAMEMDAMRVDGPSMRCAWAVTLGTIDLLADRARLVGIH